MVVHETCNGDVIHFFLCCEILSAFYFLTQECPFLRREYHPVILCEFFSAFLCEFSCMVFIFPVSLPCFYQLPFFCRNGIDNHFSHNLFICFWCGTFVQM